MSTSVVRGYIRASAWIYPHNNCSCQWTYPHQNQHTAQIFIHELALVRGYIRTTTAVVSEDIRTKESCHNGKRAHSLSLPLSLSLSLCVCVCLPRGQACRSKGTSAQSRVE